MITLNQVSKTFPGLINPILNAVTLSIAPFDFCVVIGPNGCGKSTLMQLIAGTYAPDAGTITRASTVAQVVQDVNLGTVPEMTLLENGALSAMKKPKFSFYTRYRDVLVERLKELKSGLEHFMDKPLGVLSGGQRQMVATLMAIHSGRKILLLDEHTSALDPKMHQILMDYTTDQIMGLGLTTLMITHKMEDALVYGNRLIILNQGKVVMDVRDGQKKALTMQHLLDFFYKQNNDFFYKEAAMTFELIQIGVLHGLILSLIAFGIMIPLRFLDFPDLSAEGAYPLGGALCATLLTTGCPPLISILVGTLAGGILALCTAQLVLRMGLNSLLAGIILSTMTYSLNLRIMGKPNIALFHTSFLKFNVFSLFLIIALISFLFLIFLHTDFGLRLRAIGLNKKFAQNYGISINTYTNLGLFTAGTLFGLTGTLMVQVQQFMDVGMGVGIVIHGLASLMIGESIMGKQTLSRQIAAPLVGALAYQQIQGFALFLGLAPSDLKFFTGSIVLLVLGLQKRKKMDYI